MESDNNSKIIGVRNGITYRVDTIPENNTPEKIRQRIRTLIELAFAVAAKEGKLRSGLTVEQLREGWKKIDLQEKHDQTIRDSNKAEDLVSSEPEQKEIRIRLPLDTWSQIGMEAHKLHISHTELTRRWILEGLSKTRLGFSPNSRDKSEGLREGFSSTF